MPMTYYKFSSGLHACQKGDLIAHPKTTKEDLDLAQEKQNHYYHDFVEGKINVLYIRSLTRLDELRSALGNQLLVCFRKHEEKAFNPFEEPSKLDGKIEWAKICAKPVKWPKSEEYLVVPDNSMQDTYGVWVTKMMAAVDAAEIKQPKPQKLKPIFEDGDDFEDEEEIAPQKKKQPMVEWRILFRDEIMQLGDIICHKKHKSIAGVVVDNIPKHWHGLSVNEPGVVPSHANVWRISTEERVKLPLNHYYSTPLPIP